MPRRLLVLLLAAGALVANAGCASDVSPALRIGDRVISNDDLLEEVDRWADSPSLLAALQMPSLEGSSPGTYPMDFVGFVMSNRVSFELHNQEFEELDLEIAPGLLDDVRSGLFSDPAATEAVFEELDPDFADALVADVARQFMVSDALGNEYAGWQAEVYATTTVEVNPRYGSWDAEAGQVVAPTGPVRPAPALEL